MTMLLQQTWHSQKLSLCSFVLLAACQSSSAQEWTRFRGPNGSGIGEGATIPAEWREADFRWRTSLPGVGHSSPVLWGNLLVVTSADPDTAERFAIGLDASDGQQLWSWSLAGGTHHKHRLNSFASATPVIDDRLVYTSWTTPESLLVVALDHQGREAWRSDLGPYRAGHGGGASPILCGELLVIAKDHDAESRLVALDRLSGEVRWSIARESKANWATPCVFAQADGSEWILFVTWSRGVTGVDPRSGKIAWEADLFDKSHIESSIASPIVAGELVLATSGWLAVRQEVVALRLGQTPGVPSPETVYRIDRGAPLCTTPLVVDRLLFLWSDDGVVTCTDVTTGKVHWRRRVGGTFYSSPVTVRGRLYNISTAGEVTVLAVAERFQELSRNTLGEPSHSTPAIANGAIYLRTFSQVMAVSRDP